VASEEEKERKREALRNLKLGQEFSEYDPGPRRDVYLTQKQAEWLSTPTPPALEHILPSSVLKQYPEAFLKITETFDLYLSLVGRLRNEQEVLRNRYQLKTQVCKNLQNLIGEVVLHDDALAALPEDVRKRVTKEGEPALLRDVANSVLGKKENEEDTRNYNGFDMWCGQPPPQPAPAVTPRKIDVMTALGRMLPPGVSLRRFDMRVTFDSVYVSFAVNPRTTLDHVVMSQKLSYFFPERLKLILEEIR
jgi:hypothetical protein